LLARHGTIGLARAVAPAVEYARDGFPVPEIIATMWQESEAALRIDDAAASLFLPGGRAPHPGAVFRNPDLAAVLEEIGGGVEAGRRFKAVQVGGPSGGCIPAELTDTRVDYEDLARAGAMMGSGGLLVMDDTDCMVDIARYFLSFTCEQSCGKCTWCRIGTRRMLAILEKLCAGRGARSDLEMLEEIARKTGRGSLCGLGKTAPNPALTTLRYFRDEYEAHVNGECPAKRCRALISYSITDRCIGCTICAQRCPARAITPVPYEPHRIDRSRCIRCGTCVRVCPHGAVEVR
jgi:Pyruvate/2-oxoacid:ferredoxin oxidoreductase delta subunit